MVWDTKQENDVGR